MGKSSPFAPGQCPVEGVFDRRAGPGDERKIRDGSILPHIRMKPNLPLVQEQIEAWMKLKLSAHLAATSLPHFKPIAARAMRQVLVDAARQRHSQKCDGEFIHIELDELSITQYTAMRNCCLSMLHLTAWQLSMRRQAQRVECRFYGGLNAAETAEAPGVSESAIGVPRGPGSPALFVPIQA